MSDVKTKGFTPRQINDFLNKIAKDEQLKPLHTKLKALLDKAVEAHQQNVLVPEDNNLWTLIAIGSELQRLETTMVSAGLRVNGPQACNVARILDKIALNKKR
jgi:hypothetical protein